MHLRISKLCWCCTLQMSCVSSCTNGCLAQMHKLTKQIVFAFAQTDHWCNFIFTPIAGGTHGRFTVTQMDGVCICTHLCVCIDLSHSQSSEYRFRLRHTSPDRSVTVPVYEAGDWKAPKRTCWVLCILYAMVASAHTAPYLSKSLLPFLRPGASRHILFSFLFLAVRSCRFV